MARAASTCNAFAIATFSSLFISLFYQSAELSSHAVYGHQMYFGGSVVGKASTIGREISPTPPLIFTGGQKVRNELPAFEMQQDILILKQTHNAVMIAYVLANFGEVGSTHP